MKIAQIVFCCLALLASSACSSTTPQSPPDVQDIQPGEKSVISAPQGNRNQTPATLEEKPL